MNTALITAPTIEPVTLADVYEHARIDSTDEDPLYLDMIITARKHMERTLGRALITQTWELYLDHFTDVIELPWAPLQSVTSVKYTDTDGNEQTVDSGDYTVATTPEPGQIRLGYLKAWPAGVRTYHDAITIRYVVGYGDTGEDVPEPLRRALLALVTTMGEYRETLDPVRMPAKVMLPYDSLTSDYRIWR